MTLSDRPRRRADVRAQVFDEEVLLYDPVHGAGIWLNATASLIWQLSDGESTVAEIIALLQASYPEAAERMPDEVQEAVALLVSNRAIEPA